MSDIIHPLKKILHDSIDSTPEKVSTYFKTGKGDYAEKDKFIGIRVPTLRKIAKSFMHLTQEELSVLIQSEINEERLFALIVLTYQYKIANPDKKEKIYQFYTDNIRYINNWNLVDSSAHLIIGAHLFGQDDSFLETLAVSQNMWERRIAIVATWYFIRNAELDSTFKLSSLLLQDAHDLIHKAVGWMLREAGKKDEARLIAFLCDHAPHMPRTMLRYAIERLSYEQKIKLTKTHSR